MAIHVWTKFSTERKNLRLLIKKKNTYEAIECFVGLGPKQVLELDVENIPEPTQVVRLNFPDFVKIFMFQADCVGVITTLVF